MSHGIYIAFVFNLEEGGRRGLTFTLSLAALKSTRSLPLEFKYKLGLMQQLFWLDCGIEIGTN